MASKNISKIVASTSVLTLLAPTILQTVSVNADQTQDQVTHAQTTSSSAVAQSTTESSNTSINSTGTSESDEAKASTNVSQETSTLDKSNEATLKAQEPDQSTTTTVNVADLTPDSNTPVVEDSTDLAQNAISMTRMRSMATQNFINQVAEQARSVAAQKGLYASVMIAQAALESAWGTSALSAAPNYNYFGIKGSYNGQSVIMKTYEDDGHGNLYTINAAFRKYPSPTESLLDNAALLRTNLYRGAWIENTSSYKDATKALTGLYATDTSYNSKLNSIIEMYGLTQYDTHHNSGNSAQNQNQNNASTSASESNTPTQNNSNTSKYTVKAGDTLASIASKFGTSVSNLISLNNIKNQNLIYVGQVLNVPKAEQSTPKPETEKPAPTPTSQEKPTTSESKPNTPAETEPTPESSTKPDVKPDDSSKPSSETRPSSSVKPDTDKSTSESDIEKPKDEVKPNQAGTSPKPTANSSTTQNNSGNDTDKTTTQSKGESIATQTTPAKQITSDDTNNKASDPQIKPNVTQTSAESEVNPEKADINQPNITDKAHNTSNTTGKSVSKDVRKAKTFENKDKNSISDAVVDKAHEKVTVDKSSLQKYTIQYGDTLSQLASRFNTTIEKLQQLNGIANPNIIYSGTTIIVGATNESQHTVKAGDTLSQLAIDYNTSVSELQKLNNIQNVDLIFIGQTLNVK